MPLDKSGSKEAFKHNVEAEVAAGKPQKQAVAIAYSVQRQAQDALASGNYVSGRERSKAK